MAYKIVIDAGHGGVDTGAQFENRDEKDEALKLALAVGDILDKNGVEVVYTRTEDVYQTPFQKASIANDENADFFISMHRNSSPSQNLYNGIETLVYSDNGTKATMARNINENLERIGFKNNGVTERQNLVVLRKTAMPSLLLEVGFINSNKDNAIFDDEFDKVTMAIADGILETLNINAREVAAKAVTNESMQQLVEKLLYRVQVGAYRNKESADRLLNSLLVEGFPAFIIYQDGLYKVQVGAYEFLANAITMEERLRKFRYNTYITT